MSDLVQRLRESALGFQTQFSGPNDTLTDLLDEAADKIEELEACQLSIFGTIYDIRKALGTDGEKAMLTEMAEEVARVRAADRADEREKCAKIAAEWWGYLASRDEKRVRAQIAKAIRKDAPDRELPADGTPSAKA